MPRSCVGLSPGPGASGENEPGHLSPREVRAILDLISNPLGGLTQPSTPPAFWPIIVQRSLMLIELSQKQKI